MVNWAHKAHVKGGTGKRRVFRFHSVNGPIAVTDGQTATFVIFVLPLEKEQRTQVVPRYHILLFGHPFHKRQSINP